MVIKTGNLVWFIMGVFACFQLISGTESEIKLQVATTQGYPLRATVVNRPFMVRVVLKNFRQAPGQLTIPGMESATVIQRYQEQKRSHIDNQVTTALIYTYVLVSDKPQQILFGPVILGNSPGQVVSNTVELTINELEATDNTGEIAQTEPVFVMTLERDAAVIGERVPFVLKFSVPDASSSDIGLKKIKHKNLRLAYLEGASAQQQTASSMTLEWRGVFFPEAAGVVTPCGKVVVSKETGHNSFFGFFMPLKEQSIISSNKTLLTIVPLPEEKIDAVGLFTELSIKSSKQKVAAGEGLVVTVTLAGTGDPETLQAPSLKSLEGLTYYDSKKSLEMTNKQFTKSFDVIVQAREPGQYELTTEDFSYFDTNTRAIARLTSNSVTIDVEPAVPLVSELPPERSDAREKRARAFILPLWLFAFLVVVPLAIVPGKFGYTRYVKKRAIKQLFSNARKQLVSGYKQQDAYSVYSLLKVTIAHFADYKLQDLTDKEIEKLLLKRYTSSLVTDWREFVRILLAQVFCSNTPKDSQLSGELFEQARNWIKRFEKL